MKNQDLTIKEIIGIFPTMRKLEEAIDELHFVGIDQADISMLADREEVKRKLGFEYKDVNEVVDNPDVPRSAYVSTEAVGAGEGGVISAFIYVGTLVAAGLAVSLKWSIAKIVLTAILAAFVSGALGIFFADLIYKHRKKYIREQLERGGLVLWVTIRDPKYEKKIKEILKKHSAQNIHAHDLAVANMA
jgi:hypothetical protein